MRHAVAVKRGSDSAQLWRWTRGIEPTDSVLAVRVEGTTEEWERLCPGDTFAGVLDPRDHASVDGFLRDALLAADELHVFSDQAPAGILLRLAEAFDAAEKVATLHYPEGTVARAVMAAAEAA